MLQEIRNGLAKIIAGRKGVSVIGDLGMLRSSGLPIDFNAQKAMQSVGKSAILAMCVTAWLTEYTQPTFIVYDKDDNPLYDHPLMDLLAQPNPYMDESEFKLIYKFYTLLTGTSYIHIVRNTYGAPIELWPRHGYELRPEVTPDQLIKQYIHTANGRQKEVPITDVIRMPWVNRNPSMPLVGISPLQACFTESSTYTELNEFIYRLIKNNAVPGVIISAEGNDADFGSPDDLKKVEQSFKDKFSGDGTGSAMVVNGGIKIHRMALGLNELNVDGLRDVPEANICGAFRVPPEYIAANIGMKSSTYNNKVQAREMFAQNILSPTWKADASVIGRMLLPMFPQSKTHKLKFDTMNVEGLREDINKRSERVRNLFKDNILTRDETRMELAYEAKDNADVFFVDLQNKNVPIGKGASHKAIGDDSTEEAALVAAWKAANRAIEPHEKQLAKDLVGVLESWQKTLLDQVKAQSTKKKDPPALKDLAKQILDGTKKTREAMVDDLTAKAADDADFPIEEIADWLTDAKRLAGITSESKLKQSADTITKEVKDLISKYSGQELKDALEKVFTKELNRASSIARTTATATNSKTQVETWDAINKNRSDKKIIDIRWLTERDGKVRETHHKVDGVVKSVGSGDLFEVGNDKMEGPALGSVAEENIGCRCVGIPVTRKIAA